MHETRTPAQTLSPQHDYYSSTYAGTAGQILLTESVPGGINKQITIVLAGYTNTTAVTIPYPVAFTATPITARALNPSAAVTVTSTSAVIPIISTATSGTIVILGA